MCPETVYKDKVDDEHRGMGKKTSAVHKSFWKAILEFDKVLATQALKTSSLLTTSCGSLYNKATVGKASLR